MAGFLGSGDLYFDRVVNSARTGYRALGNSTQFAIAESSEKKELIGRGTLTYGQAIDTVHVKQPTTISITLNEPERDNLALALLGDVADLSEGAGSVVDESITAALGKYVDLAKRNLTSGTVTVTSDPAGTTYVEGVDYEVNYRLGMIKVLVGGSISDSAALLVDYDHAAISGNRISGGASPTIRGYMRLDGINQSTQLPVQVDCEVVVSPDGEVDFLADDFGSISLSGNVIGAYTVDSLD